MSPNEDEIPADARPSQRLLAAGSLAARENYPGPDDEHLDEASHGTQDRPPGAAEVGG